MQIYFSPELMKNDSQVLNIVDQDENAVGYAAFIFDEKKMYVYGHLEDEGVKADFKDLMKPYLQGISKAKPDVEIYSYLSTGGEKLKLDAESKNKEE